MNNNMLNWIHIDEAKFESLPEAPAIYLIAVITINNVFLVIYSGQTKNIKERVEQHWSEDESNKDLKKIIKKYRNSVSLFYVIDDEQLLDHHEKFLFEHFKPQLQDRAPNVNPIEINLPARTIKGKLDKRYFE